jgi:hypothetical protein
MDEIPFLEVSAIAGLRLKKPCDFENGIKLIPWDSFPDSSQKKFISKEFFLRPSHFPGAALIKEKQVRRLHISQNDKHNYFDTNLFTDLHDPLLCITLVGPVSPYSIAKWLQPPNWAPIRLPAYNLPFIEGRTFPQKWPSKGCNEAQKLHKAFISLSNKKKSALRLPIERLNVAMRRVSNVDAAIDLGIALESIFLSDLQDDRGELTFRLKLRASRFLGGSLTERKKLFKIFGDLYSIRSRAVHTGKLPEKLDKMPVKDLLDKGFRLTANAITQIILEGSPNWHNLSLK